MICKCCGNANGIETYVKSCTGIREGGNLRPYIPLRAISPSYRTTRETYQLTKLVAWVSTSKAGKKGPGRLLANAVFALHLRGW